MADLQQRLSDLGYYNGPVTGYFDTSTQEAVSRFQQANGLAADGIVGAATNQALGQVGYGGGGTAETDAGVSPASGYIQFNDSGNQVTQLQQQLIQLGYYNGEATGVFDSQTQAAVMSFQRDRGLAVDGVVGSMTEAALYQAPTQPVAAGAAETGTAAYTPVSTPNDGLLQLGDVGAEVSDLQTRLQALGYYDGPISGSFGSQTQSALIAFQQAQGLTADGIAGPMVNAALGTTGTSSVAATSTVTVIYPRIAINPVCGTGKPLVRIDFDVNILNG
ncbi:peptidoglycan-binding protein [Leptolyngbya sp. 7M]|uniref:peptidoglycan-binding domain-containing protein n=1 Tax=Leptolyngbya sp. 7M TaxID=2812896 RepID=UPI0039778E43